MVTIGIRVRRSNYRKEGPIKEGKLGGVTKGRMFKIGHYRKES